MYMYLQAAHAQQRAALGLGLEPAPAHAAAAAHAARGAGRGEGLVRVSEARVVGRPLVMFPVPFVAPRPRRLECGQEPPANDRYCNL